MDLLLAGAGKKSVPPEVAGVSFLLLCRRPGACKGREAASHRLPRCKNMLQLIFLPKYIRLCVWS